MSSTEADRAAAAAPAPKGWLVGPGIDLLLVANMLWPVIVAGIYLSPLVREPVKQ